MKKWIQGALLLLSGLMLFTGCTAGQAAADASFSPQNSPSGAEDSAAQDSTSPADTAGNEFPAGQLTLLYGNFMPNPNNERGFYHMDSPSGYGANIFFYDYNTLEQRYLCNKTDCTHDTTECLSYVDNSGGLGPFTDGEFLYVLHSVYGEGEEEVSGIERRNLDGTGGEIMLTYPSCEMDMENVYADGDALYFDAPDGFVRLDIESFEKTLLPDPFGDYTHVWYLSSLYRGNLLVLTEKEDLSHQLHTWNAATGKSALLHDWPAGGISPDFFTPEGKSYYAEEKTGHIRCYDIATDTDTLVTDKFADLNVSRIWERENEQGEIEEEVYYPASTWAVYPYGDWLVVDFWFSPEVPNGSPTTFTQACNLKTGESKDIPFGDYFNGYVHSMMVWGETPHGLLVTEEHRPLTIHTTGTDGAPYSYESPYTVYSLLDMEDYLNGKPNFKTIAPVERTGGE